MPFKLVKIFNDRKTVLLEGDSGPLIGVWQNSLEFPTLTVGAHYQVELVIVDEGQITFSIKSSGKFKTQRLKNLMKFTGLIETIYDDNSFNLRLSQDILVAFDKKNTKGQINQWMTFQVPIDHVLIFPYNLNSSQLKFIEIS